MQGCEDRPGNGCSAATGLPPPLPALSRTPSRAVGPAAPRKRHSFQRGVHSWARVRPEAERSALGHVGHPPPTASRHMAERSPLLQTVSFARPSSPAEAGAQAPPTGRGPEDTPERGTSFCVRTKLTSLTCSSHKARSLLAPRITVCPAPSHHLPEKGGGLASLFRNLLAPGGALSPGSEKEDVGPGQAVLGRGLRCLLGDNEGRKAV